MPTPSLLIVPSRWKTGNPGKLYSQIPTNGNGDFNVTGVVTGGTSIGTRFNNIGYIEPITTSGTPRLDYYTSSGVPGCPALLVEPSGTNLLQRSEEFENSYWSKSFGNVTQDQTTAPNGLTTADKYVVSNGQPPNSPIIRSFSFAINTTYTLSLFVKRADYDTASIRLNTTETGLISNFFNLASGTATNNQIQNYGNGWYRVWVTFTTAATVTNGQVQLIRDADVRDGVAGIFIWGAQLETGTVATSYIPTTTGTVTRAADVISVSGAVSGSIGQTEGTIYAEVDIRNLTTADFARIVTLRETANANNFFEIEKRSSTQLRISARLNSGTTTTFLTHPNAVQLGTNKIAFAYQDGNYAMGFNGVVATSSQAGMTASLNQVILGSSTSSVAQLNDRIRAVALYTTRLTNAELAALTQP
jgi:hypothetical protein